MQEAFREHHGLQCGFCTPGMVMTAVAMAQENPNLTETDVRHGLEGNFCRCTGYQNIVNQSSLALERCKAWEAKMYEFNFNRPESVTDALAAITDADDGQFMAGGQTMIPVLKQRLAMPSDVVELAKIDDLRGITVNGGWVTIGAMTPHALVHNSIDVAGAIPALADLAGMIGDPHVRNRGTIGGSVANNDPAADYPAAVLGLGATVVTDRREISGDDFFVGLFETALAEGELITAVRFPCQTRLRI